MSVAKTGDQVRVHYVGKFTDGEIFDSSVERKEPIEFTVGAGQMIQGFDAAVNGMALSEKKVINIAPAEAYGEWDEKAIIEFAREMVPADMNPKEGDMLQVQDDSGRNVPVTVHKVSETHIYLDANHPMAGKELVFELELVEIV